MLFWTKKRDETVQFQGLDLLIELNSQLIHRDVIHLEERISGGGGSCDLDSRTKVKVQDESCEEGDLRGRVFSPQQVCYWGHLCKQCRSLPPQVCSRRRTHGGHRSSPLSWSARCRRNWKSLKRNPGKQKVTLGSLYLVRKRDNVLTLMAWYSKVKAKFYSRTSRTSSVICKTVSVKI